MVGGRAVADVHGDVAGGRAGDGAVQRALLEMLLRGIRHHQPRQPHRAGLVYWRQQRAASGCHKLGGLALHGAVHHRAGPAGPSSAAGGAADQAGAHQEQVLPRLLASVGCGVRQLRGGVVEEGRNGRFAGGTIAARPLTDLVEGFEQAGEPLGLFLVQLRAVDEVPRGVVEVDTEEALQALRHYAARDLRTHRAEVVPHRAEILRAPIHGRAEFLILRRHNGWRRTDPGTLAALGRLPHRDPVGILNRDLGISRPDFLGLPVHPGARLRVLDGGLGLLEVELVALLAHLRGGVHDGRAVDVGAARSGRGRGVGHLL